MIDTQNENKLGCKNTPAANIPRSPNKDTNKKKRKALGAEGLSKQGHGNKPIPLAQAAAGVKEAPVLSIQDIQEEERQLQQAIQMSKQDLSSGETNHDKANVISETVLGRKSPNTMSINSSR